MDCGPVRIKYSSSHTIREATGHLKLHLEKNNYLLLADSIFSIILQQTMFVEMDGWMNGFIQSRNKNFLIKVLVLC